MPRTAWLEIDLDRLVANVATVRAALAPEVRVDAVVKADAYGHGAVAVASWLERHRTVDGLCVATVDEGLELRRAGIELPILVLYAVPREQVVAAAAAGLALTFGDRSTLEVIDEALPVATGREIDVQLEVETGLGRAGAAPSEVAALIDRVARMPGLRLTGIWSHLAAPTDAPRSERQRQAFDEVVGPRRGTSPSRHLAATGGLLAATAPTYDRVRLGLGLYGLVPEDLPAPAASAIAAGLRPVMSLHARPIRVADLAAGHGVSYGPSFETSRPSRIATLPVGYGDGWPRILSNRASALVRGERVPLVGTVAMDAVMADVTDVAGPPVTLDDEFVLLGAQAWPGGPDAPVAIGATELALARTSISWEVVTAMARRLPRVYDAAAVPVGVRTLTEEVLAWLPESSSGTATSATSRWTRS